MKILMLGTERALLKTRDAIKNSVISRLKFYLSFLPGATFTIIVHSKGRYRFRKLIVSNRIVVYPTNASGISSYKKMYEIGKKLMSKEKFSLIIAQDPFLTGIVGYALKRKFSVPLLVNIFSSFFDDPYWLGESLQNRFFNELGKFIIKKADGIRVECKTEQKKIISLGVDPKKIFVAPVPVDLKKIMKADGTTIRKKYLSGRFKKIVLYIGRFAREKNIQMILRVASSISKKAPGVLFLIVGAGEEEDRLKMLAKNLKLDNVLFVGKIPYTLVPHYHAAADVFVLSSFYEGVPLVLIEAAAAGKPIVTNRIRDIDDVIVNGKSGFVVEGGDYRTMANHILYLVENTKKAKRMGKAGQKFVLKHFDRKWCAREFAKGLLRAANRMHSKN